MSHTIRNFNFAAALILSPLMLGACSKINFAPGAEIPGQFSPDRPIPVIRFPSINGDLAAVAFEDSFPKAGDADFNDFLTNFKVTEKINSKNQVTDIIVDFYPRALGASYDHSLLVVLNGVKEQPSNITLKTNPLFTGGADVTLSHFNANGNLLDVQTNLPVDKDVVVFGSTHAIFNAKKTTDVINTYLNQPYMPAQQSARLAIKLKNPELNALGNRTEVDLSRLRMVLHVKDTGKDIDIIDVDPFNYDSKGFPFGFIIPANWQWPQEDVNITTQYPNFANYQLYLLEKSVNPKATAPTSVLNWFSFTTPNPTGLYPVVPSPKLLPEP